MILVTRRQDSIKSLSKRHGTKEAMKKFADWIAKVSGDKKPIFVASPIAFDWCFVNYYFIKFLDYNPFGVSGIDLKSVWIGKTNCKWHVTTIDDIKKTLGLEHIAHTHNALEDAKEQSKIFGKTMTLYLYNI